MDNFRGSDIAERSAPCRMSFCGTQYIPTTIIDEWRFCMISNETRYLPVVVALLFTFVAGIMGSLIIVGTSLNSTELACMNPVLRFWVGVHQWQCFDDFPKPPRLSTIEVLSDDPESSLKAYGAKLLLHSSACRLVEAQGRRTVSSVHWK
nr:hypothetical protein CFP56_00458 [Quercus suber]